jgi:hypothetical protein
MINTALFRPLNMLYIGVVLIAGLYFYGWGRAHVSKGQGSAPGT